jgi:hypothetical protein
MSDTPLTDEEVELLGQAKLLAEMLRDSRHWESAYGEQEWYRAQEFYLTSIGLRYEALHDLRPESEVAARGLEIVARALSVLDEQRHLNLARSIIRAGRRED